MMVVLTDIKRTEGELAQVSGGVAPALLERMEAYVTQRLDRNTVRPSCRIEHTHTHALAHRRDADARLLASGTSRDLCIGRGGAPHSCCPWPFVRLGLAKGRYGLDGRGLCLRPLAPVSL
jgi:hypothetical protein